jgi:trafficking protein particle complex subunit 13
MLSRRIPLLPLMQQPASALPSYLKRTPTPSTVSPRPHSPQSTNIRPGTPPSSHRPGSPFRSRTPIGSTRSHSPAIPAPIPRTATTQPLVPALIEASDVQVDLVVRNVPRETITIEKPFTISFTLIISAFAPSPRPGAGSKQHRILSLAVQHVQSPQIVIPLPQLALIPDAFSPRLPQSGVSTPDALRDDFGYALTNQKLLAASPQQYVEDGDTIGSAGPDTPLLPVPFAAPAPESNSASSCGVVFLGPSAMFLDPIRLSEQDQSQVGTEGDDSPAQTVTESDEHGVKAASKVQMTREFTLSYLPLCNGFSTVGGLRVLLVEDRIGNEDGVGPDEATETGQGARRQTEARILEEWGVVGEVWVRS